MKCAATALSSKLIARQKDFFSKMVVDAVSMLGEMLPLNMIGMKKVQGGSLEVRKRREEGGGERGGCKGLENWDGRESEEEEWREEE